MERDHINELLGMTEEQLALRTAPGTAPNTVHLAADAQPRSARL